LAVTTARDFIEEHFGEDVTITRLAALSALSPYYFARVFEREVGLPPHAYLESVRIRKVRELTARPSTDAASMTCDTWTGSRPM
jgi:AraC-like DNA-binding protein